MGYGFDLLNDKKKVTNVLDQWGGSNFGAFGLAEIEITGTRDIAKLIKVGFPSLTFCQSIIQCTIGQGPLKKANSDLPT